MSALVVLLASLGQVTRHRVAMLLFFAMPPLLLTVVVLTSAADESFTFSLPALGDAASFFASPREITLLFVAIAAAGLFTAFAALTLMQENASADARLALAGLSALAIALGRALAVVVVSLAAACFVTALVVPSLPSARPLVVLMALFVGALVYGAFGLLCGVLFRGQLEGILVTALMVQLDAGWLQNPVYYAEAAHSALLHALPAYWPSQAALAGAFGGPDPSGVVARALCYGAALFAAAVVVVLVRLPRPRQWPAPTAL